MSEPVTRLPDLESELSELTAELLEAFAEADGEGVAAQLLPHYIRRVARFGIAAGRGGWPQIHELCVGFQQMLRELMQGGQPVDVALREGLEQWPLLLMSYINAEDKREPGAALIELMCRPMWPVPLDAAAREELEQAMVRQASAEPGPAPGAAAEDDGRAAFNSVVPLSHGDGQGGGTDTLFCLQQELDSAVLPLLECSQPPSAGDEAGLQAGMASAAEGLSLFGISAASAGLVGVMDIAQLLASTLAALPGEPAAERQRVLQHLRDWHLALQQYLQQPDEEQRVAALLELLHTAPCGERLSEEEIQGLHALLSAEEIALDGVAPEHDSADSAPLALQTPPAESAPAAVATDAGAPQADGIPPKYAEFLKLVSMEFDGAIAGLSENLRVILSDDAADPDRQDAFDAHDDLLERFALVTETIGLHGLSQFLSALRASLQRGKEAAHSEVPDAGWLAQWPVHVQAYLQDPLQQSAVDALAGHCASGRAFLGLDEAALAQLTALLSQPDFSIEEEEAEPRQTQAEAADVSLALPEDVNQQLLDSLLQELPHQTQSFSAAVVRIIGGEATLQDVDLAQRIAHTLKGSANTVGVAGIANLTHHLEDILLAFSREQQLPGAPLTTTLQEAADVLEMMSEALLGEGTAPQEQSLQVLQAVLDWANQIDLNGLPESHNIPAAGEPRTAAAPVAESDGGAHSAMRVPAVVIDELLRLAGESIILSGQLQQSLGEAQQRNQAVREQSTLFQQLAFELEQLVDVRGLSFRLRGTQGEDFDALEMDQYNELHTVTRRLVEAATDARELAHGVDEQLKYLEGLLVSQARTHRETQDTVMQTRMLPAQTIVPRLQRSVRQACRLTGKQAELDIVGADTLMDGDVLHALADPLMHILRNAIDHGIETAEQREARDKEPVGLIRLSFCQEGDSVVVRCVDDGCGIDYQAIRRLAVERGLLEENAAVDDSELTRYIFLSGFSTRAEATQVSGRGIGMDAVFKQIVDLKGTVHVESREGQGLAVEIRLPLTMITIHGLLVRVGEQVMAVSSRGVEQVLHAEAGELRETEDALCYHHGDRIYEAVYIESLLGLPGPDAHPQQARRPAMIVNTEADKHAAVLVQQVLTTQDLVIKQLGPYVPAMIGIEGATILGDGSVAPVLDMQGLFMSRADAEPRTRPQAVQAGPGAASAPTVMVVDDSLSARRSLAELMGDVGYAVVTARDGIEAIEKMEEQLPDILLVDLEMPRMNGLELTTHIRADRETEHLPVIMITSRATDKHRREAQRAGVDHYLTKPYTEDALLDHVRDQLTQMSKTA